MRQAEIAEENRRMLDRQRDFRLAADVVTDAWMAFPEIGAIAVIGSVAGALWKEVPRFSDFRRARIEIWHECGDLDPAVWLDRQDRLGELRRAAYRALVRHAGLNGRVVNHQVDAFLFAPGTDAYLGRLCHFNTCPKGKRVCETTGCGSIPFNQVVAGFRPDTDIVGPDRCAMLFRRGQGRLRAAVDLPTVAQA